ncbi:MAG: succinate dehydrogenase/fumarate reductase iron-sulfur subunit [Desulfovibrio sp.]|nr:succinate dehydrogenase/fumarate reductase iron-sulfur subunit [Desulfovibrio sp.]
MFVLEVKRFDGSRHYQSHYELTEACVRGKTLLAVLQYVKQEMDPTLNFTSNCRTAICGSCAVRVNDSAVLACDTDIEMLYRSYETDTLTLSPLANFPVISDLVVNWDDALEHLGRIHPAIVPKKESHQETGCLQLQEDLNRILPAWDCILCGICASQCTRYSQNHNDYLEPFAFAHAWRTAFDSRNADPLFSCRAAVENGLWRCVHCSICMHVCPNAINVAEDIVDLRKLILENRKQKNRHFHQKSANQPS